MEIHTSLIKQKRQVKKLIICILGIVFIVSNCLADKAGLDSAIPKIECVILLHGLARTYKSMLPLEKALQVKGYHVVNVDYPSRKFKIEKLAEDTIPQALAICHSNKFRKVHFVTHSMGGILVRYYLSKNEIKILGRVVMLSPPNKGSEVIDKMGNMPGFYWFNGPAGQQLGTSEDSLSQKLGAVEFELGVITGNRSINIFLSLLIPGDDDGKVSVENVQVEGMSDFLILPHTHPLIMEAEDTIYQVIYFLQSGYFDKTVL